MTLNKNSVPDDPRSPFVTSGVRIGTPSVTTQGMTEPDMRGRQCDFFAFSKHFTVLTFDNRNTGLSQSRPVVPWIETMATDAVAVRKSRIRV